MHHKKHLFVHIYFVLCWICVRLYRLIANILVYIYALRVSLLRCLLLTALVGKVMRSVVSVCLFPLYLWTNWSLTLIVARVRVITTGDWRSRWYCSSRSKVNAKMCMLLSTTPVSSAASRGVLWVLNDGRSSRFLFRCQYSCEAYGVVRLRPATATDVWAWSRGRSDFDPRSRTVFLVYPTVYAQQRSMYKMSHKPTSPITAINSYKTRQIKRLPIYVSLYNYSCAAVGKISTESTRRAVPLRQSNYLYSVHAHF